MNELIMRKSILYKALWLLLLLPLFSGCNDSDDVAAIFTGKLWKLNYITVDGEHEMYDFWDKNADARKKSIDKLSLDGTYIIKFEGTVEGDLIKGKVSGKTITSNFDGSWSANGKDNDFHASIKGSNDDILARNFLEGINAATSYEGDQNNLYLLYKAGQRTFRIVFRVVNSK